MSKTIIGNALPNIPWEDKPDGCKDVVWRFSKNPIIDWNPIPCAARIFNSAVLPKDGAFIGVFRADHKNGRAHIHFGTSIDGIKWNINNDKIEWFNENGNPFEPGYAYDPRFVKIEDTYYVSWCCDFKGPTIGLGMTKDLKKFTRLPDVYVPYNRNGVLFPRKINDHFIMLNRPSDTAHTPFGDIYLSQSKDLIYWGRHKWVMGKGGNGWWQGTKIGAGPVPIETKEGWLLFYHGVSWTCNGYVYSMGAVILDIDDPSKVLYRTRDYLLTPEKSYETTGFVPNVIFPCANLYDADTGRIAIYYGAADTYTAIVFGQVDEIIDYIKKNSEVF
jgi:beta-1,4-mannooligosaccharide/beta-1,4-mannosyl-N-acetylglucosamine phosphorylase